MNLIRDLDASDSYAAWGDGQNLGVYSFSTKKTATASIRAGAVAIMGNEVLVATDNGLEGVSLPDLADQVLLPDIQIDKLAAADGFVYIFQVRRSAAALDALIADRRRARACYRRVARLFPRARVRLDRARREVRARPMQARRITMPRTRMLGA